MLTLSQFIAKNNGYGLDFDEEFGYTCVDLVQFWAQNLGLPRFTGNAVDLARQGSANLLWIANTPENFPSAGDIVVWGSNLGGAGQYGHVDIAEGNATTEAFTGFDQNWPEGSLCHSQAHSYAGVLGWLHPTVLDTPTPGTAYTPLAVAAVTGSVGCRVRELPNTESPDNEGTGNMRGGVTFNVTGWIAGESIAGNNIWYRTIHGFWVWSGGTVQGATLAGGEGSGNVTDTSESVLPAPPEPMPAPDPTPTVAPAAVVQPEVSSVPSATQVLTPAVGTATLAITGFVIDLSTGNELAEVPSGTTINVAATTQVNGKLYLVTKNMVANKNNWGIAASSFRKLSAAQQAAKQQTEPKVEQEIGKGWKAVLGALHAVHNDKGKQ